MPLVGVNQMYRGAVPLLRRENRISNPAFEGASSGSPGTLPSQWEAFFFSEGTIVRTIVGTGVDGGLPYIDIRLNGTSGSGGGWVLTQAGGCRAYVRQDMVMRWSMRIARVAGAMTNINFGALQWVTQDRNFGNNNTQQGSNIVGSIPTSLGTPFSFQAAVSSAAAEQVSSELVFTFNNSAAVDVTFRFADPQLNRFEELE